MKESDYIKVKDLAHILSALDSMRHICPENNENISDSEYNLVLELMMKWKNRSFSSIKTFEDSKN